MLLSGNQYLLALPHLLYIISNSCNIHKIAAFWQQVITCAPLSISNSSIYRYTPVAIFIKIVRFTVFMLISRLMIADFFLLLMYMREGRLG